MWSFIGSNMICFITTAFLLCYTLSLGFLGDTTTFSTRYHKSAISRRFCNLNFHGTKLEAPSTKWLLHTRSCHFCNCFEQAILFNHWISEGFSSHNPFQVHVPIIDTIAHWNPPTTLYSRQLASPYIESRRFQKLIFDTMLDFLNHGKQILHSKRIPTRKKKAENLKPLKIALYN